MSRFETFCSLVRDSVQTILVLLNGTKAFPTVLVCGLNLVIRLDRKIPSDVWHPLNRPLPFEHVQASS